jgi:isopenicillin N synthase-like dioxygenase
MHDVPVVDIRALDSLTQSERQSLAGALDDACRNTGFFCVAGHGISDTLLEQITCQVRAFFQQSLDDKLAIHIGKSRHHRGYVPCGEENALGSGSPDLKEAFDIGRELPIDDPDVIAGKPFHGPNIWPTGMPEFKSALLSLYERGFEASSRISTLFATCLGLPEDYFLERTQKHLCELRIARYPAQLSQSGPTPIGCGEHTDYGILSLLWQLDEPGLELLRRDGTWIGIPRIPGTFVCILGDITSRLTNDVWRATRHRVINSGSSHRHSSVFFYDLDFDSVVEPLPRFVAESGTARYAPITMGAHMMRGYDGSFRYRASKDT